MKVSPIQKALVQFNAELSSKTLIILYMNEMQVNAFSTRAFSPDAHSPFPAEAEIFLSSGEDDYILKWGIEQARDNFYFQIVTVMFNPRKLPPALIGANGQLLKSVADEDKRIIPFQFKEGEADEIAEQIVRWALIKIGKIKEV